MSFVKTFTKLVPVAALLLVSACTDGWEAVYTKDVNPYANNRTAGSGVVYVRKVLMPVKMLSLKPIAEKTVAVVEEPVEQPMQETSSEKVQQAIEKFFTKKQAK